ncbi:hypothetical protein DL1_04975 [Thioclava dalianensis]|uniref:4Fe-4S ferredoxin-type domain-containing protein n=1 Tax=Thioclava dalianensis TaxID=1185766 RepID=A0A074U3T7_9RHOB|nr:Coenzyme F420 hydrogenase/dehydrogenase, beta subunit C-terminal domain [Thioclava dalianensis]KEP69282.1 hypothetical protein DL1_04975 [Thioclava dalianensis]SFM72862.1 Coenzyme F420-reducing hydrogenase, beta subunit [Thioclava dalianensis]
MTRHAPILSDPSPTLARVAKGERCAGCGICAGIAPKSIVMEIAPSGFARPVQGCNLRGSQEARIEACCPGLGQAAARAGEGQDPLWGPYREMKSARAADPGLRDEAPSGGALAAIARHLLASGRVDGVIQIVADPQSPSGARTALCESPDAVSSGIGALPAPSSPLQDLSDYLARSRRYAFIGKPCDAAALRALAWRDPQVARAFPVVLSFFCEGVAPAAGQTGLQPRCGVCADVSGLTADLSVADAAQGESFVLARTAVGAEILAQAEAAGVLEVSAADPAALRDAQPVLRARRRALFARLAALRLLARPIPRYHGLDLRACARQNPILDNLRSFAGTLRESLARPK